MTLPWFIAEFIGTFTLIFIGAGSICLNDFNPNSVGLVGIAIAHGLAIGVMVSALGHISGGKFNPAITLGLLVGGKISVSSAIIEIIAQLAGAIFGALCLEFIFPTATSHAVHLGTPALADGITPLVGIIAELITTFLLVLTVYASAIDPKGSFKAIAGLGIGGVILFDILAIGGLTGGAMNPARAFGPALISGSWAGHYVYWVGPILGGLLAGLLYNNVMLKKPVNIDN